MASHRILVVDDDLLVRINTAELLEEAGFEVIEALDAAGALAILEEESSIDLVCTDVHMPGELNGIDLAIQVRIRHPETKVIVMSGYSRRSDCPAEIPYLTKPFQSGRLVALAREQLVAHV